MGAACVLLLHAAAALPAEPGHPAARATRLLGEGLGGRAFAIVLFLLVSGYVVPCSIEVSRGGVGRFALGRFWRLFPLYWIGLVLCIAVPERPDTIFVPATVVANATMVPGVFGAPFIISCTWTLGIELVFYALCAGLAAAGAARRPPMLAGLGALATSVAAVAAWLDGPATGSVALLAAGLALAFTGAVWRRFALDRVRAARPYAVGLLVMVIATASVVCLSGVDPAARRDLTGAGLALAVFLLATRFRISSRLFAQLGLVSYATYIMQTPMIAAFERSGLATALHEVDASLPIVFAFCSSFALGAAMWAMVEMPLIRRGRHWSRRPRA